MTMLIIFLIGMILFCIYMLIRNQWVFKYRIKWNNSVHDYRINLIKNQNYKILDKYSYFELLDAISSYGKMLLMFWEWRLSKFIEDQDKFNLVIKEK